MFQSNFWYKKSLNYDFCIFLNKKDKEIMIYKILKKIIDFNRLKEYIIFRYICMY